MSHDPVTRALMRVSWLLWLILVFGLLEAIWSGLLTLPSPTPTAGYVPLDIACAVFASGALLTLLIDRFAYHADSSGLAGIATWVAVAGWTIFVVRFWWMLLRTGDIPVHPMSITALLLLAAASILGAIDRWAQPSAYHRAALESPSIRGGLNDLNWPSDNFENTP